MNEGENTPVVAASLQEATVWVCVWVGECGGVCVWVCVCLSICLWLCVCVLWDMISSQGKEEATEPIFSSVRPLKYMCQNINQQIKIRKGHISIHRTYFLCFILLFSLLLEYTWFTVLCQFLLHSIVTQSYIFIYMYTHTHSISYITFNHGLSQEAGYSFL